MKDLKQIISSFAILIFLVQLSDAQTFTRQVFQRNMYFNSSGLDSQTPVQMIDPGSATTRGPYAQQGMIRYGSNYYLMYRYFDGVSSSVYLRTSSEGTNWSDRRLVTDDTSNSAQRFPAMVVSGDLQQPDIDVVWQDSRDAQVQVRFARSTDGGQTFGPSVVISSHGDSQSVLASLARDDSGNLYVVWNRLDSFGQWSPTWFSRSTDNGLTWTPMTQIHTGRIFSFPAKIVARNNGELLVGICDDQNSRSNLVVYTSTNGGDAWQLQQQPTSYQFGEGFRFFNLVRDGSDNIHFLYNFVKNNELRSYRYLKTADWGANWINDRAVSDSTVTLQQTGIGVQNIPAFAITPQGVMYAAWADKRNDLSGTNFEVYLSRSTDGGNSWDSEIQVNEMPEIDDQSYAAIAVSSDGITDTVVVVWSENRQITGINDDLLTSIPTEFTLEQNYPNPFNPSTTIRYELSEATQLSLSVYSIDGAKVRTLAEGIQSAGAYQVVWDGRNESGGQVSSGIYLYRLETESGSVTRKMLLAK